MSSRYYLLWTFWRILFPVQVHEYTFCFFLLNVANFSLGVVTKQTVSFSDFFLADILTSLSKVTQTFYNIYDVLDAVSEQDKVYAQVLSDLERSVCRMVHRQVSELSILFHSTKLSIT